MHTPSSITLALALLSVSLVNAAPLNPTTTTITTAHAIPTAPPIGSNYRSPGVSVSFDGPSFHVTIPVSNNSTTAPIRKRDNTGRIEVHWEFADVTSTTGVCGDIGGGTCTAIQPSDQLWVSFYADPNSGLDNPTCSDFWDITVDNGLGSGVNGRSYYSQKCDILAIFDGPNPNFGAVETYASGHGIDCGWVGSPDHTGPWWVAGDTNDYYHHCSWGPAGN